MQNNFNQADSVGICTCASLTWARQTLKRGRGLNQYSELGLDDHTMNAQMAVLRRHDNDPAKQCELAQLQMVGGDRPISSIDQVTTIVKATAPHVAIFWTRTHTMGYRYAHREKEFFDNEQGLFRAGLTKHIAAKMAEIITPYGPVEGLRVVSLRS
jgi:hypothetical protein